MKMIIQAFGGDTKEFSNLLKDIAKQIDNGEMSGGSFEDEFCYNYILEDETYYRKFMIYSNDHVIAEKKESKILGITFGKNSHEAFETFNVNDDIKNIVIREVIGNPIYKIVEDKKVD
ncbi:hypothetical protein [uncultured Ilyobacter sp.]|uniref:hypothetical protein n=1 Tax=uncultured Ilyobacter sp. TaxID=544433 RepID=UPI0029F4C911|nr:hypothetical protein [uncultured Ilyobacter sp.]